MSGYRLLPNARVRIGEIYAYSRERWGAEQADRYFRGLFDRFRDIVARKVPWRPIPAIYGVRGYCCRYERHIIYWRVLEDGQIGIVTVLHQRMHREPLLHRAFND